jgi:hypothetical protein
VPDGIDTKEVDRKPATTLEQQEPLPASGMGENHRRHQQGQQDSDRGCHFRHDLEDHIRSPYELAKVQSTFSLNHIGRNVPSVRTHEFFYVVLISCRKDTITITT